MNAQRTVRMILPGLSMRSHEVIREEIYRRITKRCGGVTTWRGWGWWDSGILHGVVHESIEIAECVVSSWNIEDRQFWIDLAHYARKHLHQEAIMLSIYGDVDSFLIDSDFPDMLRNMHGAKHDNIQNPV